MSSDNLNDISVEELLKLLEKTDDIGHNDPFVSFLRVSLKIDRGEHYVKVEDIIRWYKNLKYGKISLEKAILVCKNYLEVVYIKAIPYFKINRKNCTTKKGYDTSLIEKMKYEYFIESNNIVPGEYPVDLDVFYNYYDTWCYETRKHNQFTKREFNKLSGTYFKRYRKSFKLNRDLKDYLKQGDVEKWRKRNGVQKEKA